MATPATTTPVSGSTAPAVTGAPGPTAGFITRRSALMNNIAGAYYQQMKSQSTSQNMIGLSEINLQCTNTPNAKNMTATTPAPADYTGSPGDTWTDTTTGQTLVWYQNKWGPQTDHSPCKQCLLQFMTLEDMEKSFSDPAYAQQVSAIKNTACRGLCVCNMTDIDMTNTINFSTSAGTSNTLSADAAKKIATQVQANMAKQFGDTDTSDEYNKKIVDIATSINISTDQSIQQSIVSEQIINDIGTGTDVSNVTMTTVTSAVLNALASTCSDPDCGVNGAVNMQMTNNSQQVTKAATSGFKAAFKQAQPMLLGIGIFVGCLIILNIVLTIARAAKHSR